MHKGKAKQCSKAAKAEAFNAVKGIWTAALEMGWALTFPDGFPEETVVGFEAAEDSSRWIIERREPRSSAMRAR